MLESLVLIALQKNPDLRFRIFGSCGKGSGFR
jgi:hypothetical protein